MTTDTKQPPDTDRWVLVLVTRGSKGSRRIETDRFDVMWAKNNNQDVIDWREMPSWDRLRILDTYDEERKEWEAKVSLLDGVRQSLIDERDTLRSQVTALTEERDRALGALREIVDVGFVAE